MSVAFTASAVAEPSTSVALILPLEPITRRRGHGQSTRRCPAGREPDHAQNRPRPCEVLVASRLRRTCVVLLGITADLRFRSPPAAWRSKTARVGLGIVVSS